MTTGENASYFFKPRIGKYYKDGFKGYKTLVLGVKHHCTLNKCEYYQKCVIERGCRDYDKLCPCYVNMEDQSYYCLSNSNTIEIDSYIEENDKYPKYSLFTEAMMGIDDDITKKEKEDFWEHVTFYNYLQFYCSESNVPSYYDNNDLYEKDFQAFKNMLQEIKPEVIYVWNPSLRIFINKKIDNLEIDGIINAGRYKIDTLTVNRYLTKYLKKMRKKDFENIFKEFKEKFFQSKNNSDSNCAKYMLHSIQQERFNRYVSFLVEDEMKEFVRPYIWNLDLILYLIDIEQNEYKLNDSLKNIGKYLNQHISASNTASTFYIKNKNIIPLQNPWHQELSWFSLNEGIGLVERNDNFRPIKTKDDINFKTAIIWIYFFNCELYRLLYYLRKGYIDKIVAVFDINQQHHICIELLNTNSVSMIVRRNNTLLFVLEKDYNSDDVWCDIKLDDINGDSYNIKGKKLYEDVKEQQPWIKMELTVDAKWFEKWIEKQTNCKDQKLNEALSELLRRAYKEGWLNITNAQKVYFASNFPHVFAYVVKNLYGYPWKDVEKILSKDYQTGASKSKVRDVLLKESEICQWYKDNCKYKNEKNDTINDVLSELGLP